MAMKVLREFDATDGTRVRLVSSTRRTKSVGGKWEGDGVVITVPDWMDAGTQAKHAESLVRKMQLKRRRSRPLAGDADLAARAAALDARYLGAEARPVSVRWVTNQNQRWASATRSEKSIRLSHRLQKMPVWVQDAVLVHELAHLIADDGHGPKFQALTGRYARMKEADAFLAGASFAWENTDDA
ncbi:M48 family metallopeptidase [Zhihengliuella salsuginis]|uniref:Metal-dependent hydrolase n=1 Tax=Zhihengliuella salsuginis TaxID=578222 RepID=A0ABQ3GEL8_9MICC|nr:M48 family metallopeptidase [Zhihengliuella salsuginis]GHD03647.1 metal-dependent hydrolase [Zhihengliuella salsuginis]